MALMTAAERCEATVETADAAASQAALPTYRRLLDAELAHAAGGRRRRPARVRAHRAAHRPARGCRRAGTGGPVARSGRPARGAGGTPVGGATGRRSRRHSGRRSDQRQRLRRRPARTLSGPAHLTDRARAHHRRRTGRKRRRTGAALGAAARSLRGALRAEMRPGHHHRPADTGRRQRRRAVQHDRRALPGGPDQLRRHHRKGAPPPARRRHRRRPGAGDDDDGDGEHQRPRRLAGRVLPGPLRLRLRGSRRIAGLVHRHAGGGDLPVRDRRRRAGHRRRPGALSTPSATSSAA